MTNEEVWKNIELAVGSGENNFTMSRGSFKYKQKIKEKTFLNKVNSEDIEGGFRLNFSHPKTNEPFSVDVTEDENGRIKVMMLSAMGKTLKDVTESYNRFWISFKTNPKEHIYGCGETYSKFDLKGEKVRIFVAEHQNANRIGKKLIKWKFLGKKPNDVKKFSSYESYYAQPTFTSSDKYYVHADINRYSEFDFSQPEKITLYTQEPPVFYFEKAESFTELSKKLTGLLGRQRALPDWIFDGAILAVQKGCDTIDAKIKKAEAEGTKVCGIWSQDWCGCRETGFGYQVMWNWEWDQELYKGLDKKIPEWKEKGIRFLGYINPFIALEKDLYKVASEKGYCVKDKEGKDYQVTITTFPAAMVDFTNPEAYRWYKNLIKENMIGLGMGGWMADFGEYLPVDAVLYSREDPEKLHNQWPAIWAKMNREAIDECNAADEVFFFTRAGHTNTVKYSTMMWTGDQHVDWSLDDGLPSTIPATLSLAMSGFGITHSDAGGYTTVMQMTRSKELLLRWEEMCAFTPLYRTHEGNQPTRDVQFDDDKELLEQLARTSKWHANLKEYLKGLIKEETENGTPVMRPLFYHYNEEKAYTEMTEYLLGRDMLVAPVYVEGAVSRDVYLPEDTWVHAFTGKEYKGGVHKVDAPVGQPAVFVRKGAEVSI